MKKQLVKLANHLDEKGLYKESDYIDNILKKAYEDEFNETQNSESNFEGSNKVYVLFLETGESDYIKGVFDSSKKAEEAKKQLRSIHSYSSYSIEEFDLNKIYN
jgi:hypothetical protein